MNKMDIVYPLGRGSQWKNLELKYSLRSLERHLIGFEKIYIIGEKPLFINDKKVRYIYHPDKHANPARNIMEKFMRAAEDPHISKDFLFMNDDYFFTRKVLIETYADKMVYKRTLEESIDKNVGNWYQRHLQATLLALKARNLPTLNFDTHCPLVINSQKLREIVSKYSWDIPHGYTLRSLYCNEVNHPNKIQELDHKVNHPYTEASWHNILKNLPECFSIGDNAITYGFKKFMESQYPIKSQFEL